MGSTDLENKDKTKNKFAWNKINIIHIWVWFKLSAIN